MPDGTPLETTARVASALAVGRTGRRTVVNVQQLRGCAAPYTFNGLVRHYYLRPAPHSPICRSTSCRRTNARAQSHEMCRTLREAAAADGEHSARAFR